MGQRPWTAILTTNDNHFRAINIVASLEMHEAKAEIENQHQGYDLVALVPGTHAGSTLTFCQSEGDRSLDIVKKNSARYIDPYDTSHVFDDSPD